MKAMDKMKVDNKMLFGGTQSLISILPPQDEQRAMSCFLQMDDENKVKNIENLMKQININSHITDDFYKK